MPCLAKPCLVEPGRATTVLRTAGKRPWTPPCCLRQPLPNPAPPRRNLPSRASLNRLRAAGRAEALRVAFTTLAPPRLTRPCLATPRLVTPGLAAPRLNRLRAAEGPEGPCAAFTAFALPDRTLPYPSLSQLARPSQAQPHHTGTYTRGCPAYQTGSGILAAISSARSENSRISALKRPCLGRQSPIPTKRPASVRI